MSAVAGVKLAEIAVGSVISGAIGAGINAVTAKKPKADPAIAAAQRRQEQLQAQQNAAQQRQQRVTDEREQELSGNAAAQRRALTARSSGRGPLAFGGADVGLKTTLGG